MELLRKITDFADRPIVSLVAGLFMVIASANELGETLFSFSEGLQGHHAIIFYGIVVMLRSLADLREGFSQMSDGTAKKGRPTP